jgi:hypothetical protein
VSLALTTSKIDILFAKKEFKPLLEARLRENKERDEQAKRDSGELSTGGSEEKVTHAEHQEQSGTVV